MLYFVDWPGKTIDCQLKGLFGHFGRICLSVFLGIFCYESSTPTSYVPSSPIFQSLSVSEWVSVRHRCHLTKSPSSTYKGINALYWPSTHLYRLVTHSWTNWIQSQILLKQNTALHSTVVTGVNIANSVFIFLRKQILGLVKLHSTCVTASREISMPQ